MTEYYIFKDKTKRIQQSFLKEKDPTKSIQRISALVKQYIEEFEIELLNVVQTKDKLVVSEREVDFLADFSNLSDPVKIKSEQVMEDEDDPFSNFLECEMEMKSDCSEIEDNEEAPSDFMIKEELTISEAQQIKDEQSILELSVSDKESLLEEPQERKRKKAKRETFSCSFCEKTLNDKSVYTSHVNQHACIPFLLDNSYLNYVECPKTLQIFANAEDLADAKNQKLKKKSGKSYTPKKGVKSCGYCNNRFTDEKKIKEYSLYDKKVIIVERCEPSQKILASQ